jgi:hypothetical protein
MAVTERIFSYEEAAALLPEVRRLTESACARVETLKREPDANSAEALAVIARWGEELESRGVHAKGLWLADFDNGSGFYCWRYPEDRLEYYHTYEDGFRGRMRIH